MKPLGRSKDKISLDRARVSVHCSKCKKIVEYGEKVIRINKRIQDPICMPCFSKISMKILGEKNFKKKFKMELAAQMI